MTSSECQVLSGKKEALGAKRYVLSELVKEYGWSVIFFSGILPAIHYLWNLFFTYPED